MHSYSCSAVSWRGWSVLLEVAESLLEWDLDFESEVDVRPSRGLAAKRWGWRLGLGFFGMRGWLSLLLLDLRGGPRMRWVWCLCPCCWLGRGAWGGRCSSLGRREGGARCRLRDGAGRCAVSIDCESVVMVGWTYEAGILEARDYWLW